MVYYRHEIVVAIFLSLVFFTVSKHIWTRTNGEPLIEVSLAQAAADKAQNTSRPFSEIQFRITDASLGKARLMPVETTETVTRYPSCSRDCLALRGDIKSV